MALPSWAEWKELWSLGDHNTFTKSMQSTYYVDQVSDRDSQQMEQCMPSPNMSVHTRGVVRFFHFFSKEPSIPDTPPPKKWLKIKEPYGSGYFKPPQRIHENTIYVLDHNSLNSLILGISFNGFFFSSI
jgi:hypothetical protein